MKDRDLGYLRYMYEFAKRVERRILGVSLETFLEDIDLQDSVLFAIGHIGEFANKVSDETRDKYHDILWYELVGIRNRIFHSYGDVNMRIVYNAASINTPQLIKQLESIAGVV